MSCGAGPEFSKQAPQPLLSCVRPRACRDWQGVARAPHAARAAARTQRGAGCCSVLPAADMSDAAPAKAQKTGRGDTPHRGGGRGGGFKKHQGGKQQRGGTKARPQSAARPPRRLPRSPVASLAAPHYAVRRARRARGPSRDATLTCARRQVPRTAATRRRRGSRSRKRAFAPTVSL